MIVNSKLSGETKIKLTKRETATLRMAAKLCHHISRVTEGDTNKHAVSAEASLVELADLLGAIGEVETETDDKAA